MPRELSTRPNLTPDEAVEVVRGEFGIAANHGSALPSDRDQNFLVQDRGSSRRYVLKVSHAGEDPKVLDLQNRMLEHLTRAGFPLSDVIRSKEGREVVALPWKEGSVFRARLLTWVPGTQMFRVNPQHPSLLQSLGSFLGGMDRALEDFSHPAQDRELKWDLRRAAQVVETHLEYVEEPERRSLLESLARSSLEHLGPLVPELRLSVIHADANDHNVLVGDLGSGADPAERTVSGLVDFGDAVRSYTVGEVAIAGAYAMLGKGDPFSAAAHIVRGYHRALPLREAEIAALFPLMGLRLCASVAISAHQKRLEPDNDYLVVSEAPAWDLLKRLSTENLGLPHLLFRQACELDPVPASGRIVEWLGAHGGKASPVVAKRAPSNAGPDTPAFTPVDLSTEPLHIFDLRWESLDLLQAPDPEDAEAWTATIWKRMKDVGAEVGVGRYDEVRQWYGSKIFQTPGDDPPEWRTVHLGVDIFLDAGSPVLAPFDAVVHSMGNNVGNQDYGPTVILEHGAEVEMGGTLTFWTLYGHLAGDFLSRLEPGQTVQKGEAFAQIGDFPENGNWAPHLHFQVITNLLGLTGNFPGVAPPSQRDLWKSLSPDPNAILGIPDPEDTAESPRGRNRGLDHGPAAPGRPSGVPLKGTGGRSVEEILEARGKHLGPTLSVAYKNPIKIVRGSGQFLYDDQGQPYLDCVNNVPHVGHNHPRVVEAGQAQMAILNTNTRYLHDYLVDYAERLVGTMPDPLSVVYFTCTGSEANELALRMARTHTKRRDVVVVEGGYHGSTSAMVDLSPYKFDRAGGEGAPPWVHKTLMPDPYRGRFRSLPGEGSEEGVEYLPPEALGQRYGTELKNLLAELASQDRSPAAFFCEPLLGCGGQIVLPDGYLAEAFQHVREAGGVCVADEVQVGFGRVGTHFWGFETQSVVPDIVTLGKPMANGHPLSAVITTPEIAASFVTGMEYFNTFGGNPVSLAIGMAVLDVMEEEGLQENARVVGHHLLEGLRGLKDQHELLGDVRGLGLYIGAEIVADRTTRAPDAVRASRIRERLREHRILLSTDGPDDNVLKIKPPLVFNLEDADRLILTLGKVLQEDGIRP
jgi:4-aminobutyrate aminotransferase-like enzyme/Ser/Thr protein kinase RdoA (MazF antagonist)/murein DD-endopeptidase MepM/ murein hydrolase activator NlpD